MLFFFTFVTQFHECENNSKIFFDRFLSRRYAFLYPCKIAAALIFIISLYFCYTLRCFRRTIFPYIYIYIYIIFLSNIFIIVITKFRVTKAKNCWPLTRWMNVSYVARHERADSLTFLSMVRILWVLILFWYGYVKSSILRVCKGNDIGWNICACYSWAMALNVCLDTALDNMLDWKGIHESSGS
jgi:hypothetical protein